MIERNLDLMADFFQFYLQDEDSFGLEGDEWTDAALAARLALIEDAFAVSTARNMMVPVTVRITDHDPGLDLAQWDHVVEFSIDIPSGRIVVAGMTDYFPDALRIDVEPGGYRTHVCFAGLDTISDDGLDGQDRYLVEMWRAGPQPLRVLKQFSAP